MTKAEIIASLLDQAQDKDSLDNGEADNIFAEDAKALRKAVEMLEKSEEARHGHWTEHHYYIPVSTNLMICSECRALSIQKYAYCPHCGAKMDGKGEAK